MRNGKLGCLLWIVLFCLVALTGWKLINFFILGPAAIKKGLNETVGMVDRINTTAAKQVEFSALWAVFEDSCDTEFSSTAFQGDSFVVEWKDTLHIPVFPSIQHTFRLTRVVI
jgi:hypothetical protein